LGESSSALILWGEPRALSASPFSPVLDLPEQPWVLLDPREQVRIISRDQLRVELPPLDPLGVLPLGV